MELFWATFLEIALIGIGLAMDSFAVSVCDGIVITKLSKRKAVVIASTFGLLQGTMAMIGYFIGSLFYTYIESFDHWVAFVLLGIIGGKMLYDGIKGLIKCELAQPKPFSYRVIFFQGIGTSIDALVVGITLCSMTMGLTAGGFDYSIFAEAGIIAAITFVACIIGVLLGKGIYRLLKCKYAIAEVIGGVILIGIGAKILIEHLIS